MMSNSTPIRRRPRPRLPHPPEDPPRVAALVRDLITASRIEGAVGQAGGAFVRVDTPDQLPPALETTVLIVDWSERTPAWGTAITAWCEAADAPPRIVLFGPHTDIAAHLAARDAGLGPMRARSALLPFLKDVLTAKTSDRDVTR